MTHTSITPEMIEAAEEAYMPFGDMGLAIQCALAAAPQPPEAAPVELPEPFAYVEHHKAGDNLWFDHPGGKHSALYTEQQVRQLLADHGIQEQST